jgi:hypothetical protein
VHAIRTSQKGRSPAAAKHNNALNSPDKITNLSLCKKEKLTKILGAGRSKHHHSFYIPLRYSRKETQLHTLKFQQGDPWLATTQLSTFKIHESWGACWWTRVEYILLHLWGSMSKELNKTLCVR